MIEIRALSLRRLRENFPLNSHHNAVTTTKYVGLVLRCPGILGVYFILPLVPFASHRWFPLLVFRRDNIELRGEINYWPGLLRGLVNIRGLRAIVEFNMSKLICKGIRIRSVPSCKRGKNFWWFWLVVL